MLVMIICAFVGAVIVGVVEWTTWKCGEDLIEGGLFGLLVGVGVGFLLSIVISAAYCCSDNNYIPSVNTYDLTPYTIEDNEYYATISNSKSLSVNVQYFDELNQPESLHLSNNTEYVYDKSKTPSIQITSYSIIYNPWILFLSNVSSNKYVVTLPDNSAIYHCLN